MKHLILLFAMILLPAAGFAQTGGAIAGTSLTWSLSGTTLTISGTGAMPDYTPGQTPWESYRTSITTVVIDNGVASIGRFAFSEFFHLTSVSIPSSVTDIITYAFSGCDDLTSINIPSSVTSIGDDAFSRCSSLTSISVDAGNTVYA
jgi:hypothetical protein